MSLKIEKINIKPNKSLTYMLPFLDDLIHFKFKHRILNTYTSFTRSDDLFCILYDWTSDQEFLKFEGELMAHHLYVSHEDIDAKVLYKFRLPEKLLEGRSLYLAGDYKNFSDIHKNTIVDFLTEKKVGNLKNIIEILSQDSDRVSEPPDLVSEVFDGHVTKTIYKEEEFKYEGS
tara:strand:- start:34 stop:555 length:522 start_codon:yes stop_codon:yes gene_type:complete